MTASDLCRLIRMYRVMLKIRLAEERIGELVEAGEIQCPCHLCIGQEAIATGVCEVLRREDYVCGEDIAPTGTTWRKGAALTA